MFEPQFCIDWLTLTFPPGTLEASDDAGKSKTLTDMQLLTARAKGLIRKIVALGDDLDFSPCYPHYGMRLALALDNGAAIHFCPAIGRNLDCVIVLPGKSLVTVRTAQRSTRGLARRAIHVGARCSRLDVAIDVFEGTIESYVEDAKDHITGDVRRSATVLRPLDDLDGTTLYIGSRKSSRMLRVYEKAKQLKVDIGCPWIRIELEAKRKVSRAMFIAYANGGITALVSDIVSRYQFRGDVWNTLLYYATPGLEARRILVEGTQGKATKSEWVLRHIGAIAQGIDEMTLNVFITSLATRASSLKLPGLMNDLLTLL
jgi:predicted small secreted protein